MTYGLPYMGSKSNIADWVIAHLPPADTFVDLFAGGCAVTHAALLSGRFRHVIANDVQGDVPALFRDALQGILPPDYLHAITREEFHLRKGASPYIRLVWSFGSNAQNYIFGEDVERIKLLAHSMLCEDSLHERHRLYGAFYSELVDLLRARPDDDRAASISSINRIKRILALRSPALAERLTVSAVSYDEVCPPPVKFSGLRRSAVSRHRGVCRRVRLRPVRLLVAVDPVSRLYFGVHHAA